MASSWRICQDRLQLFNGRAAQIEQSALEPTSTDEDHQQHSEDALEIKVKLGTFDLIWLPPASEEFILSWLNLSKDEIVKVILEGVNSNSFVLLRDSLATDDGPRYSDEAGVVQMTRVEKKENILEKSIGKLKETGTDVWQGTQLLANDVAAAMGLLKRALIGEELTEKEKKTLKRTLTDMASVV
ncbi:hypothetical protein VNO80_14678 [Phaseolus coccineus]|uniref:Uncharacterized protein n=1 Tax=Phaseolus coccineus TaxID=3886 RepID=A0AAN9MNJ1_PHACN